MTQTQTIEIGRISEDFSIDDLSDDAWKNGEDVSVDRYWSGEMAPIGRRFKARLLWSKTGLYVRFVANRSDPLVVSEMACLDVKTMSLWERDVCEIFIAPDRNEPRRYFEFEVAPNGEWIDLTIDLIEA